MQRDSIKLSISSVSWCWETKRYFCERYFLRQETLQLSCMGTAALIPRMVTFTLDTRSRVGSSRISFWMFKRLFPVTLLMSLAEMLAETAESSQETGSDAREPTSLLIVCVTKGVGFHPQLKTHFGVSDPNSCFTQSILYIYKEHFII